MNPRIDIAPMLDYTHRHARYFYRLFSPFFYLYTEMVVAQAILHTDPERFLKHHVSEYPLILQIGGSDPAHLEKVAHIAKTFSFSGINLNVGCPSERVKSGKFGACLMAEPELVADCLNALSIAGLPVSMKCRLGIDEQDGESSLDKFTQIIYDKTRCREWIIHARKAWLKGLNPKQNREVPPLNYDRVYRLQKKFSECHIILNGGIENISDIQAHLKSVYGVMIGREIIKRPQFLAEIQEQIFNQPKSELKSIMETYLDYVMMQYELGEGMRRLLQPLFGLFYQVPNAKAWRLLLDACTKRNQLRKENILSFFN